MEIVLDLNSVLKQLHCICRQLFIGVDAKDDNYMPHHVVVKGGDSQQNLKELGEVFIDGLVSM